MQRNTAAGDVTEDDDHVEVPGSERGTALLVEQPLPPPIAGEVRIVRNLTHNQFRNCLVEHFNILFLRNDIKWPRRLRQDEPRQELARR